jgi:hypothetical protein
MAVFGTDALSTYAFRTQTRTIGSARYLETGSETYKLGENFRNQDGQLFVSGNIRLDVHAPSGGGILESQIA